MTTRLSLVVPAYNEADRLSSGLSKLVSNLSPEDTEILVVDDGSSDGTADVARQALAEWPQHSVISLPYNSGKGAAVRAGVVGARGDVIAFVDADMATDPRDLTSLVSALEGNHIAVGSRALQSSVVDDRSAHRTVMTRTFGLLVTSLMRMPVTDTQCGFKAFKGSIAKLLFHGSRVASYAFDVEVLNLAVRLGLRTQEVPVRWTHVEGSHVRPVRDAVQMVTDVARTRRSWKNQPPIQGVYFPELDLSSAEALMRAKVRNVDLIIEWQQGTAVLFPCLLQEQAYQISSRLLGALESHHPQRLNVEFDALFTDSTAMAGHAREEVS